MHASFRLSASFMPARLLALGLVCVLLAACAARVTPVDPGRADAVWQSMLGRAPAKAEPYRDTLSLRFGTEGSTRRVTALIWGNGGDSLRLDVRAGVGATIAMLSQQEDHFLLYAPMEEKAWFHEGATSPLLRLGLPLPITLFRLEALLHGRHAEVFGASFLRCQGVKDGIEYELEEGMGGRLTVSADGLPVRWQDDSWRIEFSHEEDGSLKRLDLANIKGEKGIVLVRQREHPAPFDEAQMRLELPEGTRLAPLSDMRRG
ncbi:MAG: hypothetical protein Q4F72_09965 [Desulfovibrionaceae bacterium]|nr:hypothetical protein [Desulfovibrionaceae bacterium]